MDNSATNFVNQLNNGVPILPYIGEDQDDTELSALGKYLISIHDREDLTKINR